MHLRKDKLINNDKNARNAQKNLDFIQKTLFNMISGWRKMQQIKRKKTHESTTSLNHKLKN